MSLPGEVETIRHEAPRKPSSLAATRRAMRVLRDALDLAEIAAAGRDKERAAVFLADALDSIARDAPAIRAAARAYLER